MTSESDPTWAPPLRAAGESRGANQSGVRLYNERLVLSLVRRHGSLAKADMARLTGLSPQTATIIVNRLEADGLLVRQARQRGRVGQPAAPFALNSAGAFAFGLKMGRRSSRLVLIDFVGRTGNAGALGSMPIAGPAGMQQLIRSASLYRLETKPGETLQQRRRNFERWLDTAAASLAVAIVSAASVIDFQAAVIDGAFDEADKAALLERVRAEFARLDRRGLSPIEIEAGAVGMDARSIGAASLPFLANFTRDREVLFKEEDEPRPQTEALAL